MLAVPNPVDPDDALDTEGRQLLYDLVSTPSVSGEEADAAAVLVEFLEAHGREAFVDEVGNVRAPADDSLLLTSHVDTVPGEVPVDVADGDEELGVEGPVLWGRGSVDATGPLAAMAVAAVETGVSFVGVTGEETDSRGARHLVETRDAPEAVINGEPSGWDAVTLGYRGLISGTYVATSESGHTSRPDPNAVEHAIHWWQRVEGAFDYYDYGAVFEQVTTKPVAVDGGLSEDGLSMEATMDVQFRVPPSLDPEDVRERADAELDVGTVHWNEPIPPVMGSPRDPVATALRGGIRKAGGDPRLLRKTGTADVNLFAGAWDVPMATYGPGDSALDHAPDERLPLREFDRSVDVLTDASRRLRGRTDG
ncbi:[LysW]-lysine hydrolase [Halobaculum magnesiiphilum]|uniref:Putative [LysW]-lysine/[LysW]-ornithine hydrolase n=1 Tax=Halobaculum magnesiiphilum TaxID=1017351 RepID=A0A8T8WA80_9EURY|nr:[LysW]-lysine hydrolase [Halobaculum magnesiiphilum]QZP36663.1 [LysW]-lysine hydrolase [Halobaculum magnesiiphilum]